MSATRAASNTILDLALKTLGTSVHNLVVGEELENSDHSIIQFF